MPDAAAALYDPADYRPDESVAYLVRGILGSIAAQVGRELQPSGLTRAQWIPLIILHLGVASTAAELARECRIDTGAMTRTLDRLEAKGLIKRVRSSEDRRVVKLGLTSAGRKLARLIPAVLCRAHNSHLRGFTREECALLTELLRRMLANTEAVHPAQHS